jgi:hypothetical protein
MVKKTDKQRARELGISVRELREVEQRLRAMPMDHFLEALFGPNGAVYDTASDLWIAPDPKYSGPGFGFMAIRRDKSFFRGVIPPEALQ